MGNCSSDSADPRNPDYNVCNEYDDTMVTPGGFCAAEGFFGDEHRNSWCADIGDGNEWYSVTDSAKDEVKNIEESFDTAAVVAVVFAPLAPVVFVGALLYSLDNGKPCLFDPCHAGHEYPSFKCCSGCCALPGNRGICVRKKFNADPFVCCLLDSVCVSSVTSVAKHTINENDNGVYFQDASGSSYSQSKVPEKKDNHGKPAKTGFDTCWQTPRARRTCHPSNRDLGNKTCRENVKSFCTGDFLLEGQEGWEQAWRKDSSININANDESSDAVRSMKAPCFYALIRGMTQKCVTEDNITVDDLDPVLIDPDGFKWAKEVFRGMFQKYLRDHGTPVATINSDGDVGSAMHDVIWEICQASPGLCEDSLKGVCSGYTAEDVATNPGIAKWCGCYLPDSEYEKYVNLFQINKECTPLCARNGNIPLVDSSGSIKVCQENICLIDDITVKMIESQGLLGFGNVCQSCGSSTVETESEVSSTDVESENKTKKRTQTIIGSKSETHTVKKSDKTNHRSVKRNVEINRCSCTIADVDITVFDSVIKKGLNLTNNCGQLSCFKTVDGIKIPVACGDNESEKEKDFIAKAQASSLENQKKKQVRWGMIIFGSIVIFIVFIWIIINTRGR